MQPLWTLLTGVVLLGNPSAERPDPPNGPSAAWNHYAALDAPAQRRWMRDLLARLDRANRVLLERHEAAAQRARYVALMRRLIQGKRISPSTLQRLVLQTDRRERAAIERLAREFCVQVYHTFRQQRGTFTRRRAAAGRVRARWEAAGSRFAEQGLLLQWFQAALVRSTPGTAGPLPADPDFDRGSKAGPTMLARAPLQRAEKAGLRTADAPGQPGARPAATRPEPRHPAAGALRVRQPIAGPADWPPVAAAAGLPITRRPRSTFDVFLSQPDRRRPNSGPGSRPADPPRLLQNPLPPIMSPAQAPTNDVPVGLASLRAPRHGGVSPRVRLPSPPARPAADYDASAAVVRAAGSSKSRLPERSFAVTPNIQRPRLEATEKLVGASRVSRPARGPLRSEPISGPRVSASGLQGRTPPPKRPRSPRFQTGPYEPWPVDRPVASVSRASAGRAGVAAARREAAAEAEGAATWPAASALASVRIHEPTPILPQMAPPAFPVQVNLDELAARIAGNNMALQALAAELDQRRHWNARQLGPLVDRLGLLVMWNRDLATFRRVVPPPQRALVGRLESPQTLISHIGGKIFRARVHASGPEFQGTQFQRQAELKHLDALSRELAELASRQ